MDTFIKNGFLVLVVDDNPQNLQVLAAIIEECGGDSILAMSGKEALESIQIEEPDLILLDVMMPEMDGYELCQKLKNDPIYSRFSGIPVIFITAKTDSSDIINGFKAGGVDYIAKPFVSEVLKMRILTHVNLYRAKKELSVAIDKLQIISVTDPLTNLYNRRHVILRMEDEILQIKRYGGEFSIILCDIDFFKRINDTHGHDCGDMVLKRTASLLKEVAREQDIAGRWGGEEFLIVLPKTSNEGAVLLAERMRKSIEDEEIIYKDFSVRITLTLGVSTYVHGERLDDTIKRADLAMYRGKENGRNKVVSES